MERISERVRDTVAPLELPGFFSQLVKYTEGAEYDQTCEVLMAKE